MGIRFLLLIILINLQCGHSLCRPQPKLDKAIIGAIRDVDAFCSSLLKSQAGKNKWPFEGDCHRYYHCFYANDSSNEIMGRLNICPRRTFFNYDIQDCLAEGPFPCHDMCLDGDINDHGCFAVPNSCSTFFSCTDKSSQPACCLPGNRFNPKTCQCERDDICEDPCLVINDIEAGESEWHINKENMEEAAKGSCIDSYGNRLFPGDAAQTFYFSDGTSTFTMHCSSNTVFNFRTCQCQDPNAEDKASPICLAYFPFNGDFKDHSLSGFVAATVGKVSVDRKRSPHRAGSSARFDGGYLMYDAFKKLHLTKETSVCFFYQCDRSSSNALDCLRDGSLLSRALVPPSDCEFEMVSIATNRFMANVSLEKPNENIVVHGPVNSYGKRGFTQICVVFNGKQMELYVNKVLYSTVDVKNGGQLKMAHCPLTVGYGHRHNSFIGNIDELLICRRALTIKEIRAHFQGPQAMRTAQLIPAE